jgi:hypothetical protein
LKWQLLVLQSRNKSVHVLFVDVKKLYKLIFCLRSKAFNLNLSRICSLHKGRMFGKNTALTHLNANHPEEGLGRGGGGVARKIIPFFCLTCSITTFVLGSSFSFSFVQGFQSGGGAVGGVRPVSAPQTSEGAPTAGGFRSVGAPVTKPGTGVPPLGPPLAAQPANCWVCGRTVSGVFLQVKGIEYGTKFVFKNYMNKIILIVTVK